MAAMRYTDVELLSLRFGCSTHPVHGLAFADMVRRDKQLATDILRASVPASVLRNPARQNAANSSTETLSQLVLYNNGNGNRRAIDTKSEWRYAGRSATELDENDPLVPPTGIEAQRDEGFERFYQSVVSPTNIRVTAGGKIVPNPRGSPSPTGKWNREKDAVSESHAHSRSSTQVITNPTPFVVAQMPMAPPQPPFNGMPGMPHPAFRPVPVPYGMVGGYPMPPHPMQHAMIPQAHLVYATVSETRKSSPGGPIEETQGDSVPMPPQVPYNPAHALPPGGQWVTTSHGNAYFPVTGPALAGPYHQPFMPVQNVACQPMFRPVPHPGPQYATNMPGGLASSAVPSTHPFQPSGNPPPTSSIRPSEITKKHLEFMRYQLRDIQRHLQYDEHQIDVRVAQQHAAILQQTIGSFEAALRQQLAHESAKPLVAGNAGEPDSATNETKIESSTGSNSIGKDQTHHKPANPKSKKEKHRIDSTVNHANSTTSFFAQPQPESSCQGTSDETEPVKKSSAIPITAALAPPFRPRAEASGQRAPVIESESAYEPREISKRKERSAEEVLAAEKRLLDKGSHGWAPPERFDESMITELPPMIPLYAEPVHPIFGSPYFVATLRKGADPLNAGGKDWVYEREFTYLERRARFMYENGAGLDLIRNDIKFDGRNFYPPEAVFPPEAAFPPEAVLPPVSGRRNSVFWAVDDRLPTGNIYRDYIENYPRVPDPFAADTVASPMLELPTHHSELKRGSKSDNVNGLGGAVKVSAGKKAREETKSCRSPERTKSSTEDTETEFSILGGRRSTARSSKGHARNDLLGNLVGRGSGSAHALPGAVTSMTAHGYLPQYSGYAAASLTPAIANASGSPSRGVLTKLSEQGDIGMGNSAAEKRGENRPPAGSSHNTYVARS